MDAALTTFRKSIDDWTQSYARETVNPERLPGYEEGVITTITDMRKVFEYQWQKAIEASQQVKENS